MEYVRQSSWETQLDPTPSCSSRSRSSSARCGTSYRSRALRKPSSHLSYIGTGPPSLSCVFSNLDFRVLIIFERLPWASLFLVSEQEYASNLTRLHSAASYKCPHVILHGPRRVPAGSLVSRLSITLFKDTHALLHAVPPGHSSAYACTGLLSISRESVQGCALLFRCRAVS